MPDEGDIHSGKIYHQRDQMVQSLWVPSPTRHTSALPHILTVLYTLLAPASPPRRGLGLRDIAPWAIEYTRDTSGNTSPQPETGGGERRRVGDREQVCEESDVYDVFNENFCLHTGDQGKGRDEIGAIFGGSAGGPSSTSSISRSSSRRKICSLGTRRSSSSCNETPDTEGIPDKHLDTQANSLQALRHTRASVARLQWQKKLNKRLLKAGNAKELVKVAQKSKARLNGVNWVTVMHRLSKFNSNPGRNGYVRWACLELSAHVSSLDLYSIANVYYSLGRLQWRPHVELSARLTERLAALLEGQVPKAIRNANTDADADLPRNKNNGVLRAVGGRDREAKKSKVIDPQHLSNILWGFAKLYAGRHHSTMQQQCERNEVGEDQGQSRLSKSQSLLLTSLDAASCRNVQSFNSQAISNSMWAFAKLRHMPSDSYFEALLSRLEQIPSHNICPQHVSNIIYSCATLGVRPPLNVTRHLLSRLWLGHRLTTSGNSSSERPSSSSSLPPSSSSSSSSPVRLQTYSNIIWALGKMKVLGEEEVDEEREQAEEGSLPSRSNDAEYRNLLGELELKLVPLLDSCSHAQEVSNILWGFATINYMPSGRTLAAVERFIQNLSPDHYGRDNTCSSKNSDESKKKRLHHNTSDQGAGSPGIRSENSGRNRPSSTNIGNSSNSSISSQTDHTLSSSLTQSPPVGGLSPLFLSNVLWAYASLGVKPSNAVLSRLLEWVSASIESMGPQMVANTLWAMSKLELKVSPLLQRALSCKVESSLARFSPQEFSNIIMAYGRLQLCPPGLTGLTRQAVRIFPQCNSQERSNIFWAFSKLVDTNLLQARRLEFFLRCIENTTQQMGPKALTTTLWALGNLDSKGFLFGDGDDHERALCQLFQRLLDIRQCLGPKEFVISLWAASKLLSPASIHRQRSKRISHEGSTSDGQQLPNHNPVPNLISLAAYRSEVPNALLHVFEGKFLRGNCKSREELNHTGESKQAAPNLGSNLESGLGFGRAASELLSPREISMLTYALATLGQPITASLQEYIERESIISLHKEHLSATTGRLVRSGNTIDRNLRNENVQTILNVLWSFARLRLRASPEFQQGALSLSLGYFEILSSKGIANLLVSMTSVFPEGISKLLRLEEIRIQNEMGTVRLEELNPFLYACAMCKPKAYELDVSTFRIIERYFSGECTCTESPNDPHPEQTSRFLENYVRLIQAGVFPLPIEQKAHFEVHTWPKIEEILVTQWGLSRQRRQQQQQQQQLKHLQRSQPDSDEALKTPAPAHSHDFAAALGAEDRGTRKNANGPAVAVATASSLNPTTQPSPSPSSSPSSPLSSTYPHSPATTAATSKTLPQTLTLRHHQATQPLVTVHHLARLALSCVNLGVSPSEPFWNLLRTEIKERTLSPSEARLISALARKMHSNDVSREDLMPSFLSSYSNLEGQSDGGGIAEMNA
eukprot:CAMPEP_0184485256 /NCGR_PEP_ID=MMETSP0113_2-20130426/6889_1 /TAXON_ID=91329 /ORGANISM="Norrisiella sphaerica, Strain BC52" /LENGTH=1442 /DNA_ID=CAMNT_0026866637 /DNA_START=291 /DNA_END=4620 /DNA_ORIENTATION=-